MMEMMREVRNAELAGVGHPGGNPELHSALAASHLLMVSMEHWSNRKNLHGSCAGDDGTASTFRGIDPRVQTASMRNQPRAYSSTIPFRPAGTITRGELLRWFAQTYSMGILKLPKIKDYWRTTRGHFQVLGLRDIISRDRYLAVASEAKSPIRSRRAEAVTTNFE